MQLVRQWFVALAEYLLADVWALMTVGSMQGTALMDGTSQ